MSNIHKTIKLYKKNVALDVQKSVFDLIKEEVGSEDDILELSFDSESLDIEIENIVDGILKNIFYKDRREQERKQGFMDEDKLIKLGMEFLEAAESSDYTTLQRYIDNDYPVNFQDPHTLETALHNAAYRTDVKAIEMLLQTGKCDVLIKDHMGKPAYVNSCMGLNEKARTLMAEATEAAAIEKDIDVVKFLADCAKEYGPKLV